MMMVVSPKRRNRMVMSWYSTEGEDERATDGAGEDDWEWQQGTQKQKEKEKKYPEWEGEEVSGREGKLWKKKYTLAPKVSLLF